MKNKKKNLGQSRDEKLIAGASGEEDLDALLEQLAVSGGKCQVAICTTPIRVMGFSCEFCRARFCASHAQPEIHGCTDKAKKAAQSGPRKAIFTSAEQQYKKLEQRLHDTLEEQRASRGSAKKTKDKK